MNALICPTCGCSLVRLGFAMRPTPSYHYQNVEYHFCCTDCLDLFVAQPEYYLHETGDLQVCPACLAEKPLSQTLRVESGSQVFYFCRCPHCLSEFKKRPAYYTDRLNGKLEYPGVFGDEVPCCAE